MSFANWILKKAKEKSSTVFVKKKPHIFKFDIFVAPLGEGGAKSHMVDYVLRYT